MDKMCECCNKKKLGLFQHEIKHECKKAWIETDKIIRKSQMKETKKNNFYKLLRDIFRY